MEAVDHFLRSDQIPHKRLSAEASEWKPEPRLSLIAAFPTITALVVLVPTQVGKALTERPAQFSLVTVFWE